MKVSLSLRPLALAIGAALISTGAMADGIDFHGYFRVGGGTTSKGGNLQCFKIAPQKFRLGNECDNYAEPNIALNFGDQNKVWGKWKLTTAIIPNGSQDWEAVNGAGNTGTANTTISVREDYFSAGGFFGAGAMQNASVWVGKRFYNRHDVHMNDNYYWGNSGLGAGVEDINVGPMKLAFAYVQNNVNGGGAADIAPKRYSVRFYDIDVNPGGKLEGELVYLRDSTAGTAKRGDGTILYLEHTQNGVFGGFNKLGFVWGDKQGSLGFNEPAGYQGPVKGSTWRVIEQLSFDVKGTGWTGTATALYAKHTDPDVTWGTGSAASFKTWFGIGVRPQYNFTDTFSIATELGHDSVKQFNGNTMKLTKLTVAPQLTLSRGVWARPVLRAFVTYAKWNDPARINWNVGNGVFGSSNNGMTYGVQAEAWW